MSVSYVKYVCTNCGKKTRENNLSEPKKCALCTKVICHHCSPKGFCETCHARIPEEGKKILNRTYTLRNVLIQNRTNQTIKH